MIFFNLRGIVGVMLGGAVAWAVFALVPLPVANGYKVAYGLLTAVLVSSLFALATDRCDREGLWESYRVNCITYFHPAMGQAIPGDVGLNADRRLAIFGGPLAMGPLIPLVAVPIVWVVDVAQGMNLVAHSDYAFYTLASFMAVLAAAIFARLTSDLRTLPRTGPEPAPTAAAIEVPPTTLEGKLAAAIRRGSSAEAPTRRPAILMALIGAGGLAFNHYLAVTEGKVYVAILLIFPLVLLMGLGALVDPRIFWSMRAEGRIYPRWVRVVGGCLALAGLALSVVLIFLVYRVKP